MDVKKYVIGKPRRILAIVNMLIWVPFATMLIVFEVRLENLQLESKLFIFLNSKIAISSL